MMQSRLSVNVCNSIPVLLKSVLVGEAAMIKVLRRAESDIGFAPSLLLSNSGSSQGEKNRI